ncbi:MAG: hypothetical protein CBC42_01485 [Betaproteobacteria bacterium TMED82]|nr:MAG: hypothetical protein CBC42_01485 [Betaproteobacteria bacterium TMED82]|tara:strand:+ start:31822 stop:32547 length:726 start_codon:yes stop_codon:yes gene_type:complete
MRKKKSCFVLYFVHFENLGVIEKVVQNYYEVNYCHLSNFSENEKLFLEFDLVIVLGGPVGANDGLIFPNLTSVLKYIEKRVKKGKPTIGICLGSQLVAKALGATIYKSENCEIGWKKLNLSREGKKSYLKYLGNVPVLHWHSDTFSLPEGCIRLASTEQTETQAFSYGDNILAMQFHCEVLPGFFEYWALGHKHELQYEGVNIKQMRENSELYAPNLGLAGEKFFGDYFKGLEVTKRSQYK